MDNKYGEKKITPIECTNREYILNSIRTVQKKTKEELEKEYKEGPSMWDFFKKIGNSNICYSDLILPWVFRYEDANMRQSYRDLGDGWYILLTINKESGIVAAFKIFDKEFDINSDADTKGDILHLYTGEPKDMHEVEEVIKRNTSKNMGFVWADSAPAVLKHPKTQEMGIIPIEHPKVSIVDFIEYGKTLEYEALKALRIPINPSLHNDILGPLADHKTNVSIQDSDWLVSSLLMQSGFKGFDQRLRKLAKRRCKVSKYSISCKEHSFYKRYKLV